MRQASEIAEITVSVQPLAPKDISLDYIAKLNRDYAKAKIKKYSLKPLYCLTVGSAGPANRDCPDSLPLG